MIKLKNNKTVTIKKKQKKTIIKERTEPEKQ